MTRRDNSRDRQAVGANNKDSRDKKWIVFFMFAWTSVQAIFYDFFQKRCRNERNIFMFANDELK